ncbi:HD domain-containing protein [Clostridium sp. PL3]|uniref:HD domain-containing protein n=1 Tax=Clostridium thailandense TaxID=2794346 RepID=A0A949TV40_9CLOT|nr:HD domain-containing protein [Clostridium thailandense]MBV7275892.1 HD domain-containing protein [Clostridium thailandense]
MKTTSKEEIKALFPELDLVNNKELVDKACAIWKEAFEAGIWDDIMKPQFATLAPNVSLVNHTRTIIRNSVNMAENVKEAYGYKVDMDVLIISIVLHDVCKIVENDPGEVEGTCVKNNMGKTYQHGFMSGYYAQKYDFPEEIVATVIAHAGASKVIPRTIEGLILYYNDVADADIHFLISGAKLILDTRK